MTSDESTDNAEPLDLSAETLGDPTLAKALDRLTAARQVQQTLEPRWDIARLSDRVLRSIRQESSISNPHPSTTRVPASSLFTRPTRSGSLPPATLVGRAINHRGVLWGIVVTIGLMSGWLVFGNRKSSQQHNHVYATRTGERATFALADGTQITLAPQSQLTVPTDFNKAARTVSLSGEAYFDVRAMVNAPFVVRTNAVTTQVLGTAFGVRAYVHDKDVRVAVVTGKVAVRGKHAQLVVTAGGVAHVSDSTAILTGEVAQTLTSWTDGSLVFENAPVHTVLEELGRWYGYTFEIKDSTLAARRVTGAFVIENRAQTMALVQKFLDVTMKFDDSVVTVRTRASDRKNVLSTPRALSPLRKVGK